MNNEMPDVLYIRPTHSDGKHFSCSLQSDTLKRTKYVRADKAVPDGWRLVPIEALKVIEKFIEARNMTIDFLPEKTHENLSQWLNHFVHCVNYSLSFNDWMRLDGILPLSQPPTKGED